MTAAEFVCRSPAREIALCEFVCTSKTPVQKILSDGIELMMKETN